MQKFIHKCCSFENTTVLNRQPFGSNHNTWISNSISPAEIVFLIFMWKWQEPLNKKQGTLLLCQNFILIY